MFHENGNKIGIFFFFKTKLEEEVQNFEDVSVFNLIRTYRYRNKFWKNSVDSLSA